MSRARKTARDAARNFNVVRVGATRMGKTLSAVVDMLSCPDDAYIVEDPHKNSLAEAALIHVGGNVLYEKLSDVENSLGLEFLNPSKHADPMKRLMENQRKCEGFVEILLRKRGTDSMGQTPLMEEWINAAIMKFLCQSRPKPLTWLPFAYMPGTAEFSALVRDCTAPELRHKFRQLEGMNPRSLRSEVGSASRFLGSIFRSPAFQVRARGGFNLGAFLQKKGRLIIERGDDMSDDAMRTIMGAVNLLAIDHAKQRKDPYPLIHIIEDEATNARLVGDAERRGIAELSKNGCFFEFLVQNDNFPGGSEEFFQNCLRHEWFGCPLYELARKGAVDILSGLPRNDESRAQRLDMLTNDIMNLKPGWRLVRDPSGSRKEYVPLLQHPWPDWPGLREAKLQEKLKWIYARPEYGAQSTQPDSTLLNGTPSQRPNSPKDLSAGERWKLEEKRRADGLADNDDEAD